MIQLSRPERSVLIVDDEPQIRELLQELLEEHDCTVFQAPNGKEAFRISQTATIDVLITDLIMPDQEGIETIQRFRNSYPHIKIIAISGASDLYLQVAKVLGADATFRKPLNLGVMSAVLSGMLEFSRMI